MLTHSVLLIRIEMKMATYRIVCLGLSHQDEDVGADNGQTEVNQDD